VQGWVDFNNTQFGMTVATPDNPMVQLGDFHFGQRQKDFLLERAVFLGWVTNNYWGTNFRAHQPGEVRARYRMLPYAGGFNEIRAHRFGAEAAHNRPLLQQFGEPRSAEPLYPATGALLRLPGSDDANSSILTLHIKPANNGIGIIIRLLNAGDEVQTATIGSSELQIVAAQRCSLLEEPLHDLPVKAGDVEMRLSPRELAAIHLTISNPKK
jgi:alpha-mannosidase